MLASRPCDDEGPGQKAPTPSLDQVDTIHGHTQRIRSFAALLLSVLRPNTSSGGRRWATAWRSSWSGSRRTVRDRRRARAGRLTVRDGHYTPSQGSPQSDPRP